jgi:hypothetical protein
VVVRLLTQSRLLTQGFESRGGFYHHAMTGFPPTIGFREVPESWRYCAFRGGIIPPGARFGVAGSTEIPSNA